MRLFVLTALASFATPAFACGMYIPMEFEVASIGDLMEEVDGEVADDGTVTDEGLIAEVAAAQPTLVKTGLNQPIVVSQSAEPQAEVKLTRKERRQLKRLARASGV